MTTGNRQEDYAAVHVAIGVVSAVCDYARKDDGRGFNAADAWARAHPRGNARCGADE